MPDFWTHIIGGESIVAGLNDDYIYNTGKFEVIISAHPQLFNFGCQGPDFFFYNDVWPWKKEKRGPGAGRKLQLENINKTFVTSAELLKESLNKKDFGLFLTYFTGFLAHYYLDRYIHPFIERKTDDSFGHKRLELLMDCYFVKKKWGKKAYKLAPVSAIELGNELPQVVIDYFKTILSGIHDYPEHINFINHSYLDMKKVLGLFYSPYYFKRVVFKILNILLRFDLNALLYPAHPDYTFLTQDEWGKLEKIFNRAIEQGRKQLKLVLNFINGDESLERVKTTFIDINFAGKKERK